MALTDLIKNPSAQTNSTIQVTVPEFLPSFDSHALLPSVAEEAHEHKLLDKPRVDPVSSSSGRDSQ
eukprot:3562920-Amphidinium_carterae.1